MKSKKIVIGIFVTFLFFYPIFTWADFKDDFNDGISRFWENVRGIWEPLDGFYHGKDNALAGVYSLLPLEAADGVTIKVRAMENLSSGYKNFLVVFAYVSEDEVYFAGGAIILGQWEVARSGKDGWDNPGFAVLASSNSPIVSKKWYSMELKIEKTTVSLSVDGNFKVKHIFAELPKGRLGLSVHGGDSMFDDFEVTGVKDLSVQRKSSLATTWAEMKGK